LFVIKAMPWLKVLDSCKVKEGEKEEAALLQVPKLHLSQSEPSTSSSSSTPSEGKEEDTNRANEETESQSSMGSMEDGEKFEDPNLFPAIRKIKRKVTEKRILMKDDFRLIDPRRSGQVTESQLFSVLEKFGIRLDSEEEGALMGRYCTVDKIWATKTMTLNGSITLGHIVESQKEVLPSLSASIGRKNKFNYVAFCRDIEPKIGGRDFDNSMRVASTERKLPINPISSTVQDLERDVSKTLRRKKLEEEESIRRSMINQRDRTSSTAQETMTSHLDNVRRGEMANGLDPWVVASIRRKLKALQESAEEDSITNNKILSEIKKGLFDGGKKFSRGAKKKLIKKMEADFSPNGGQVDISMLIQFIDNDDCTLKIAQKYSPEEAKRESDKLFEKSTKLLDEARFESNPESKDSLQKEAMELAQLANLYSNLSTQSSSSTSTQMMKIQEPSFKPSLEGGYDTYYIPNRSSSSSSDPIPAPTNQMSSSMSSSAIRNVFQSSLDADVYITF